MEIPHARKIYLAQVCLVELCKVKTHGMWVVLEILHSGYRSLNIIYNSERRDSIHQSLILLHKLTRKMEETTSNSFNHLHNVRVPNMPFKNENSVHV